MVSIHCDNASAASRGFAFQLFEEVEDFELIAAAVKDVADLDYGGGASGIAVGRVDDAGEA